MSKIIREFYEKAGTPSGLIDQKLTQFERHPDIAKEFEHWIDNKKFKGNGVEEQGYTAWKLATLSEYLNGEGAFALLIELRENPQKALKRIERGFKIK